MNHLCNDIIVPNPDKCITTKASSYGWGVVIESQSRGGLFSTFEIKENINVLELKAILFGLKALGKGLTKVHIYVLADNSTAVACTNKFGTSWSLECDSVTKEIWQRASDSFIWLSATHLPWTKNSEADFESRKHKIYTEWKLIKSVFHFIRGELGFSSIMNLLATRINTQLRTFVFYRAGLNCVAENVFLINWEKEKFYAFLPLACLPQTLQKIYQDKAKGILIGPDWPSQPYYPRLIEIFLQTTSIPPRKKKTYIYQAKLHYFTYFTEKYHC